MILSVSRRTDIPAFYTEWFFKRLKEGFAYVRNPMNYHMVSRISLRPEDVDCIVFWTKNPHPMIERLGDLSDYKYYFQISINPYGSDIERFLPRKKNIIDDTRRLSEIIGKDRVVWRYDPIILTDKISPEYHGKYFEKIASRLNGYTKRCVISFVDFYSKTKRNMKSINCLPMNDSQMRATAGYISSSAGKYGIKVQSCCEKIDLSYYGIDHGKCIDDGLIRMITGVNPDTKKDKNQRKECGCVESVDIGAYNTCKNGCLYCYANFSDAAVKNNFAKHDPDSPFLTGSLEPDDKITQRKSKPSEDCQISFF